jgi:hypothetical protein
MGETRFFYIPPTWAILVSLLAGGIPFSLFLGRLGSDIGSPEFLRYLVLGSPWLFLLLILTIFRWRTLPWVEATIYAIWSGVVMCVPAEGATYVWKAWEFWGWGVFLPYNLPFLLLILTIWSMVLALPSAAIVFVLRRAWILLESYRSHH